MRPYDFYSLFMEAKPIMLPLKSKTDSREDLYRYEEVIEKKIADLKEFRDIGEKFNYLGVEIITIAHSEFYPDTKNYPDLQAVLKGHYKNEAGEIKTISFDWDLLPAIKAENE